MLTLLITVLGKEPHFFAIFNQSTKLFEKNPLFSIKQPNLSISCKIR